jgi:hypothetical protein
MLTDDEIRALRDKLVVCVQEFYSDLDYNSHREDWTDEEIARQLAPLDNAICALNALLPYESDAESAGNDLHPAL